MCTATALLEPRPGRLLFGASLLFLSAVFSYPGLAPVVLVYVVIVIVWLFKRTPAESRGNGLRGLGAGVVVTLLAVAALALHLRKSGLVRLFGFTQGMGYGTQGILQRLDCFEIMAAYWHWLPIGFSALYALLPLACLLLRRVPAIVATATPVPFAFCYWHSLPIHAPTAATICLTALC